MFRTVFRRFRPSNPGPTTPAVREAAGCTCGRTPPAFEGAFDEDSASEQPGHISEAGPAPAASFEPAIPWEPDCKSLTATGEPCLAPARKSSGFCIFHDPNYRDVHRANSVTGGRASALARQRKEDELLTQAYSDPEGRTFLLGYLLEGQMRGKLTQAQANSMLRTVQMLFRAERAPR